MAIFALTTLLAACFAQAQSKEIKLFTASTVYTNILSKIEGEFKKRKGITLTYVNDPKQSSNALDNLRTVIDGKAEAGTTSIAFDEWSALAAKNKLSMKDHQITHRVIGKDIIDVLAHKGVGLKKISFADLAKVFSGEAKNWKEVGGADVPITIFVQEKAAARNIVFKKKVLPNGAELSPARKDIVKNDELLSLVAKTPGAVSFLAAEQIKGDVINIDTPEEIARPITLITKGKPSQNVLDLVDFITSAEGRQLTK